MASGPSVVIITSPWAAPLSTFCSGFGFKLVWPSSDLPHQVWSGQRWSISLISSKACIKHHVVAFAKKQTLSNLKNAGMKRSRPVVLWWILTSHFLLWASGYIGCTRSCILVSSLWPSLSLSCMRTILCCPDPVRPLISNFISSKTQLQRSWSYHVVLVRGYTSTRVTRGWG